MPERKRSDHSELRVEQAAKLPEEACLLWVSEVAYLLGELGDQLALTPAYFLRHFDDDRHELVAFAIAAVDGGFLCPAAGIPCQTGSLEGPS